jgi:hypothetical protein
MRLASVDRWRQPDVTATLRPHVILYELLRNDLGVQLADGHSESAEFAAMSATLEKDLRGLLTEPEFATHMETRRRLVAVALEPLTFDEPAYDEAFNTVLSLTRQSVS